MNTNTEEIIDLAPLSQLKTKDQDQDQDQDNNHDNDHANTEQMHSDNTDLSKIMATMLSQLKVKDQEQDGEEVHGQEQGQGGMGDFSAIMSAMLSQLKVKEGEEGQGQGQAQDQGDISAIMSSMLSQLKTKGDDVHNGDVQDGGEQEGQGDATQIPRLTLGDININDILAKLMGNIDFNNDETLDSDYLVTEDTMCADGDDGGEGVGCEGCEECEGCEGEGDGDDIIEEADLKAMFENFNDANLMNNFKSMIELLSKKIHVSTVPKEEEISHMEDVD